MKLFQRLLVAPAALGLMAPVAVNADSADSAFEATTILSGTAFFTTGQVDGAESPNNPANKLDNFYFQYAYGLDLNTSFTGEDNLYVGIEAGTAEGPMGSMDSAVDSGNDLEVANLFYTFPYGDVTITAGPRLAQDEILAATTSAYSDSFQLGALPYSQAGDENGPGVGFTYSHDSGFIASGSFISVEGWSADSGINSDTRDDVKTVTVGYDSDGWGLGLIVADNDGQSGGAGSETGYKTFGGGVYWSPEAWPATFSLSFDTKDLDGSDKEEEDWLFGLDYEIGSGILSLAYSNDDTSHLADGVEWEAAYAYQVNDSITVTPGIYFKEETNTPDDTGFVVETVFTF